MTVRRMVPYRGVEDAKKLAYRPRDLNNAMTGVTGGGNEVTMGSMAEYGVGKWSSDEWAAAGAGNATNALCIALARIARR